MAGFSEKRLVEDYLARELERLGWTYIPPHDLPRTDLPEVLILEELEAAIHRLNEDLHLTPDELRRALTRLQLLGSGVEGHKRTLEYLKQGIPIKRDKTHEVIRVRLVDPHHPDRNRFFFTRQLPFEGHEPIRPDILLFVNGIPLVDIECKNPARPGVSWEDAYKQIKRYEQSVPELYHFIQMGVAAEREARYFPIVPWKEEVHTYTWRTARKEEDPLDALLDLLRPVRLLDLVQYFLYFREERNEYTKVLARYMQVRAANRIVRRVLVNMQRPLPPVLQEEEQEDTGKTRGLVWHWQGSGKTLTMIFASQKLFRLLGNPTLFFVVDRVDLQDQLEREFSFLHIPVHARKIQSVRDLQRVLRADGYQGERGIFITLIHKFRPEDFQHFRECVEREVGHGPSFRTRSDIVLFVDEGHRTQYGVLGAEMYTLFPAGFAFGFTGTPLAAHGRDTFRVFAYPERGELYLDKYFVSDSLRDGYT
ncbi:MAG: HsdR family type I site-specific deoxyribonuclease, partial [Candidatus Hydrothermae bacterium]|nr:HsdR family type I site-specific deoxyribonuclease [Candidatus Hydrothermae bacterium]